MADFDEQWSNIMKEEYITRYKGQFDFTDKRVKEFLKMTDVKSWYQKDSLIKDKICLDAGCGPGRWTYAMQRLGAARVDSFDISAEAIKRCKEINPDAYVFDIWDLKPNPAYDFVLSWGVLHHTKDTRTAFSKVASQVKKGGMLHVMIYNKVNDWAYDGYRGPTCVEKHKEWVKLSTEEKIKMCQEKVKTGGSDVHGWFDAFNPEFNWSHSTDEVKKWFEEEGFTNIKFKEKPNINMNGILQR
ncbi:MAG: methyltransferase domain-containing protein [Candidatus Nitrosotalea sp.]|nr:methyltransferase domain-containing protein [Candidatus Nitrosotalea sp.]